MCSSSWSEGGEQALGGDEQPEARECWGRGVWMVHIPPDQREKSGLLSDYFLNPGERCEGDVQEALFQGPWNTPRKRSRDVCLN